MERRSWSEELLRLTRDRLPDFPFANVKNIDGSFGISVPQRNGSYIITLLEAGGEAGDDVKFKNMDKLIEAGWAID